MPQTRFVRAVLGTLRPSATQHVTFHEISTGHAWDLFFTIGESRPFSPASPPVNSVVHP